MVHSYNCDIDFFLDFTDILQADNSKGESL